MAHNKLRQAAIQRIESLQRAGVTHVRKAPKRSGSTAKRGGTPAVTTAAVRREPVAATACGGVTEAGPTIAPAGTDPRVLALAKVACDVAGCSRCEELARTRTQTVFGVGNPHARLVFCGEAPGADEDRQGEPFVGRAGQLLTDIIVKGMKVRREDVYILNVLRCRPPGNRTPAPDEAANCREFLDRQLAIIQPEFICCLGAVAAQNLLSSDLPIGRLRGRVHDYHGVKVVCTYHPAYLLRNPPAKRYVWDDIQMLMAEMDGTDGREKKSGT
ncbi:MAG: uracil-DNA glycosylase [Planctomycetaceae bacterium]|nr:uracil-DNA glycosylase [Planctomycetaceae bacterium]